MRHSPGPMDALERLCELAVRDQWRLETLDFSALDVSSLPLPFRQAGADAFAQLHWGERTALVAARRLALLLPPGLERRLVELQINDELRHVRFFEQVILHLGCEGRRRPSVERLMLEVEEARSAEELVLGMQILIEGAAHSLFLEAARWVDALPDEEGPLRALRQVLGEWLPLLARDESRHIAFGVHFLRERLPALSAPRLRQVEEKLAHWAEGVLEQARDPDLIEGVGLDGNALCDRLVEDLNLRISQVGLSTRISKLRAAG
jgi:hypothetical protein